MGYQRHHHCWELSEGAAIRMALLLVCIEGRIGCEVRAGEIFFLQPCTDAPARFKDFTLSH